ncbi:MAG: response regulator [Endomicrobiales bacterium]|nr:response regulator [Endomicrobiales bacterium]
MTDKKRVLLADDEDDIRHILKRYLELDGYEVTTAIDGKDALEKAVSNRYDLLILDVMMPVMNGWEVSKKLKADPERKNIPIIILTARTQSIDSMMSYECGADEYATKPFEYPELSQTIKKLIEQYASGSSGT